MLAGLIPLIIGFVFSLVGCFFVFVSYGEFSYTLSLNNFIAFTPEALIEVRDAQSGYVEGIISDRNKVLMDRWAAYVRYNFEGMEKYWETNPNSMDMDDKVERYRPIWNEDERKTPPMLLEVGEQEVELFSDYRIEKPTHVWISTPDYEIGVTKKYEGFQIGEQVVAVGRSVPRQETPVFQAKSLYGGSFQNYRDSYKSSSLFLFISGIFMAIVGVIAIAVGIHIL